jgi:hypothetical protein
MQFMNSLRMQTFLLDYHELFAIGKSNISLVLHEFVYAFIDVYMYIIG